ncbi:uncharacterized protein LOC108950075 [Ciona intestinalis]
MNNSCIPSTAAGLKYGLILPSIQIVVNMVPLIAILANHKQLVRLKSVYIHVANSLLANVTLALFVFYTMLNFVLVFERPSNEPNNHRFDPTNPTHRTIMEWWTFQKSFTVCIALAGCFSVVGLIFGLKETMYFPSTPQSHNSSLFQTKNNRNGKRLKTGLIIGTTWGVPIVCSLVATFSLNCFEHCKCLPAYYEHAFCKAPDNNLCSVEYLPVSKSFLIIVSASWLLAVVFLITAIFQQIKTLRRNMLFMKYAATLVNSVATLRVPHLTPRDITLKYVKPRGELEHLELFK